MKITLDIPQIELEKLIAPAIAESRIPLYGITWHLTYLKGFNVIAK